MMLGQQPWRKASHGICCNLVQISLYERHRIILKRKLRQIAKNLAKILATAKTLAVANKLATAKILAVAKKLDTTKVLAVAKILATARILAIAKILATAKILAIASNQH